MATYVIKKGFIAEKVDKQLVIFDSQKSLLYSFNETASYIFQQLKKGLSDSEVVSQLSSRYKITVKRAQKDVKDLIRDLLHKKIIEKESSRPT